MELDLLCAGTTMHSWITKRTWRTYIVLTRIIVQGLQKMHPPTNKGIVIRTMIGLSFLLLIRM